MKKSNVKPTYIRGSKGTKPTPTELIPKPLPPFVHTTDVSLFPRETGKGKKAK